MKNIKQKYDRVFTCYKETCHEHTNLSAMTATTLRDKELSRLEGEMVELVSVLGSILEAGQFPYGREVSELLYPVPNYTPSRVTLETAGRGMALSLRTGQMTFNLDEL